jgi:hypothetical protein
LRVTKQAAAAAAATVTAAAVQYRQKYSAAAVQAAEVNDDNKNFEKIFLINYLTYIYNVRN